MVDIGDMVVVAGSGSPEMEVLRVYEQCGVTTAECRWSCEDGTEVASEFPVYSLERVE